MPLKVKCSYCGEPVYRTPSKVKRGEKHFCDKDCGKAYRKTPEGKAWMQTWCQKPTIRIPHWKTSEVKTLESKIVK